MGETVSAALASWLKDEKQGPIGRWKGGLEGGSARAALSHIRRLDRMLGKKLLSEITPKEIERVVLTSEAPATRNRALCAFRGFLSWAIRNGLIETIRRVGCRRNTRPPGRASSRMTRSGR